MLYSIYIYYSKSKDAAIKDDLSSIALRVVEYIASYLPADVTYHPLCANQTPVVRIVHSQLCQVPRSIKA